MSKFLADEAIASFDAMVHETYQGLELLAGRVRTKTGIIGLTHRFSKYGKGMAKKRTNPYADVVPMNVAYSHVTATLEEWDASEYSSIWDNQVVPWDEKSLLAKAIRQAVERRKDQIIIDAALAGSTSLTVSEDIGGSDTGLNLAKFRRADRLLGDKGVPGSDRVMLASHAGKEDLLGETPVTSKDYGAVASLVNGQVGRLVNFEVLWMETRDEGGLPLTDNVRTNIAWHKEALGLAVGVAETTDVNYIPTKKSWLNSEGFKSGAVAIDTDGLVEIETHETAA